MPVLTYTTFLKRWLLKIAVSLGISSLYITLKLALLGKKFIFSLIFQKLRDLHDAWIETLYNNGTLEDRSGETIFNGFKV